MKSLRLRSKILRFCVGADTYGLVNIGLDTCG